MGAAGGKILVAGAGVFGLWQALGLARAGFQVTLVEQSATAFAEAQSRFAGAMLSPYCEEEGAHKLVRELGLKAIELWAGSYPGIVRGGTLVVAAARDQGELVRFQRVTSGHRQAGAEEMARLEPDLAGQFRTGLFYEGEAHMVTPAALDFLLAAVRAAGVDVRFGARWDGQVAGEYTVAVDCRGMGAQEDVPGLRGVRGERLIVRTREVQLGRPVRLLHPRHPLYVVPWGEGLYMVGATVVESEDGGPVSVRSALELLGLAYALHPGFGEAEIVEMGAGLRPSLPDNLPRAIAGDRIVRVNGAYRHGFLLAPVLAEAVRGYIISGDRSHPLIVVR